MVLGSEGRLGIISSATVHVHRLPAERIILGYLFPNWEASLAAMRDLAASEAAPSVTRVSDAPETAFSFATRKRSTPLDKLQSAALMTYLKRRRGYDVERDVPRVHRLRGQRAPRPRRSASTSARSSRRTTACASGAAPASCTTRRSSTPRTSATSCSTAACSPTCPRRRRRGASSSPLYDRATGAARGRVRRARRARLRDVPPVALLPLRRLPLLHVRAHAVGPARAARRVRRGEVGDPAGVRRRGRNALAPPRGRHRARAVARAGHLGARRRRCCGRCSTASIPGRT